MRFWLDTEYYDDGKEVALISLGAVAEDDREFYAISTDFDPDAVKPWIKRECLASSGASRISGVETPNLHCYPVPRFCRR